MQSLHSSLEYAEPFLGPVGGFGCIVIRTPRTVYLTKWLLQLLVPAPQHLIQAYYRTSFVSYTSTVICCQQQMFDKSAHPHLSSLHTPMHTAASTSILELRAAGEIVLHAQLAAMGTPLMHPARRRCTGLCSREQHWGQNGDQCNKVDRLLIQAKV